MFSLVGAKMVCDSSKLQLAALAGFSRRGKIGAAPESEVRRSKSDLRHAQWELQMRNATCEVRHATCGIHIA